MKAGTALRIAGEVIALLVAQGFITATDDFDDAKFGNVLADAQLAQGIEAILTRHGVHTPQNVDRVIQLLPLLAGFIK